MNLTYAEKSVELNGNSTNLSFTTSDKLAKVIVNNNISIAWTVSLDDGATWESLATLSAPIYVTAGSPTGSGVTVKRINEVTKNAQDATSSSAIANAIGPKTAQLPLDKDVSLVGPGSLTNAWQILDYPVPAAECAAVCTLMKTQLEMIGLTGAEVRYVYARKDSWDGIYQYTNTGYISEIGFYPDSFSKRALVMANGGGSADFFEGTCYFEGGYWMGNVKTQPFFFAANILYAMTSPLPKRQAWAYTKDNFVSLPTLGSSTVPYPAGDP